VTADKTARLGEKLSKVFTGALQGAGVDMRKHAKVALDDAILRCFATLSADTSEEQLEDMIYFILDIYGFHGVPVAISELDIDQVSWVVQFHAKS
jgi:separase